MSMMPSPPSVPSTITARLAQALDIRALSVSAVHVVMAMRLCVLCAKTGHDPLPRLIERFGSALAARRFRVVVEMIGDAWPDPVLVCRPCCGALSPDEAMIAEMAMAAAAGDQPRFNAVSREMLGGDARNRLFISLAAFDRARQGQVHG